MCRRAGFGPRGAGCRPLPWSNNFFFPLLYYKNFFHCMFAKFCFLNRTCAVCGLKFCDARTRIAYVILAHAASRMTFHGYLSLPIPNNTLQSFSGA